jgi:hypothetical protein
MLLVKLFSFIFILPLEYNFVFLSSMLKMQNINDFPVIRADFSVPAGDCIALNRAAHSDIHLFSRYKVLEPFAPYHSIELRG